MRNFIALTSILTTLAACGGGSVEDEQEEQVAAQEEGRRHAADIEIPGIGVIPYPPPPNNGIPTPPSRKRSL